MVIVGGVEEAGRGPVIGPLVMVVCTIEEKNQNKLKEIGVKDSKLLSPKKREELHDEIIKIVKEYRVVVIPPDEIDIVLKDPSNNLNMLEASTSSKLIDMVRCEKVILDCPAQNTSKYAMLVKMFLKNRDIEVIAEHKADVNHPIVSAASILAKVARDKEIKKINDVFGVNVGSGYPSDPKTQKFLKENFENPEYEKIFRKTWDTYRKLELGKNQKSLGDF